MKLTGACDCGAARRLWLLRHDRPLHAVSRWRLDRHLRGCAECRAFAADAAIVLGRLAPLMVSPVREAIVHKLRAEAGQAARETRPSPFSRRLLLVLPAAAVVACLALLGTSLLGRFDRAQQLDARLERIQHEAALAGSPAPAAGLRASLDDHLVGLEDSVRCLQTEVEDDRMGSSLEGAICPES